MSPHALHHFYWPPLPLHLTTTTSLPLPLLTTTTKALVPFHFILSLSACLWISKASCYSLDYYCYSFFFWIPLYYEMATADFGNNGYKWSVPWFPLNRRFTVWTIPVFHVLNDFTLSTLSWLRLDMVLGLPLPFCCSWDRPDSNISITQ